jgi:hypothetical protein
VLLCEFLHCGVLDRTETLDQGFAYAGLDPIPKPANGIVFGDLCDTIAAEIVREAISADRKIDVLWSGGIDSTAALVALLRAVERIGHRELVRVLLSHDSVREYPKFYLRYIHARVPVVPISATISQALDRSSLIVTGEHGDQLFGSYLLEPYVRTGAAELDYQDVLPVILARKLESARAADQVMRYLERHIASAPVPVLTLFDCMWWLNFSLKWQQVTLRLPVFCRRDVRETHDSMRHFFRDPRFQAWSLANRWIRITPAWDLYKHVAKQYVLAFTGDVDYFRFKEKEPSLKRVMVAPDAAREHQFKVVMRSDFEPRFSAISGAWN